jgi:AbrB family looped-hinge helix DNA binding protein
MHTTLTIDSAGQVVIPEPFRKELNLQPGDSLEMDCAGDQITLRPLRVTGRLVRENGLWVIGSGSPMTGAQSDEILRLIREEREQNFVAD